MTHEIAYNLNLVCIIYQFSGDSANAWETNVCRQENTSFKINFWLKCWFIEFGWNCQVKTWPRQSKSWMNWWNVHLLFSFDFFFDLYVVLLHIYVASHYFRWKFCEWAVNTNPASAVNDMSDVIHYECAV